MIKVEDIFDCVYGSNLEFYKLKEKKNGIPFVARTSRNNGVITKVEKLKDEKINPGHTISVSCGGSVMECFYQDKEYYSGRDLYFLKPKINLSVKQMIIYASILSSNKYKFSFGRQVNKSLPYIKIPSVSEIEKKIKFENKFSYDFFDEKDFDYKYSSNINYKSVNELFYLNSGISSSEVQRFSEKINDDLIPYIRPTKDQRYSVDAYVNKKKIPSKYIFPKNTLYVSTDGQGSHSYAYVSIFQFVPNSNVSVLIPKRNMTIIEKLYYAFCLTNYRYKFSYGRKPKGDRFKNLIIPEFPNIKKEILKNKYKEIIK